MPYPTSLLIMSCPGLSTCLEKEFKELRNVFAHHTMLHDILLLSFPLKINMDVLKIGSEYRNFRRILGEREILRNVLGHFMRI